MLNYIYHGAAPAVSEEDDALFANLCMLGLPPDVAERQYHFELNRSTFQRVNSKALEAVLYIVVAAFKGGKKEAKKFFRMSPPLPAGDKKAVKEFYARVSDFFKELKDGNQVDGLTSSTLNLLRTQPSFRCGQAVH